MTQLIGAIRRVRREVSGSAEVIAEHCTAHDYNDPGKPTIAWNDKAAREQLIDALVGDAHRLLGHLPEAEHGPKAADALALLALIAGQDVEPVEGSDGTDGRWRIAQNVAPDRVISTVDPDARHAHKTVHRRQDGFKAHVAIEPDTGIITDCALSRASGADNHEAVVALELLAGEDQPLRVLGVRHRRCARRAQGGRPCRRYQTDPAAYSGSWWLHQRRLHDRFRRPYRDLSGNPYRRHPPQRRCFVPKVLPLMPFSSTVHHRQKRAQAHHQCARTAPTRSAGDRARSGLAGRVPPTPTHGGTLHRLADPRQPQSPLPRRRQQRSMAPSPHRGAEPAPIDHPGPRTHRHELGNRLTQKLASPPNRRQNSTRRDDLRVDRKV